MSLYKYNRQLTSFSRSNRKNQTDTERFLWQYIRGRKLHGYKFRRQFPVEKYIIDFYCEELKFGIELDGSQHVENKDNDEIRDKTLKQLGIEIVRFWDNDVLKNIDGVLDEILKCISRRPHPIPLLKGEGEFA